MDSMHRESEILVRESGIASVPDLFAQLAAWSAVDSRAPDHEMTLPPRTGGLLRKLLCRPARTPPGSPHASWPPCDGLAAQDTVKVDVPMISAGCEAGTRASATCHRLSSLICAVCAETCRRCPKHNTKTSHAWLLSPNSSSAFRPNTLSLPSSVADSSTTSMLL
jgi:hypothetical protein